MASRITCSWCDPKPLSEEARQQAQQYFAQGHEVNFLEMGNWVLMSLATMGKRGRNLFNGHLRHLLDEKTMPRAVKAAWNDYIAAPYQHCLVIRIPMLKPSH